jgi:pimeloyl-ACP methyl ester carboxylesterase
MRRALTLAACLLAAPAQAETPLAEAVAGLDLTTCELSALSCATLKVPLDHRANDPSKTIDITFALSFASVESRGILFYFVGGPGGSGLASADSYLGSFDESLTQYTDIVFVDQRGTGPVHGLSCPIAQAKFDIAPASPDKPDEAIATAKAYVTDCIAELDADELLAVVNTDQAIRDSELFRQAIGAPKVWLYGESYGTQFVQAYATAFPTAVRGVILDGVVDLNLDAEGFYRRYTLAGEALLAETFAACADIPACKTDMQGDAAAVYDKLAAQVEAAPVMVPFTLKDGSQTERPLTTGLLEANAFYALYSPEGRTEFLRALAAAGRGELNPMLQLGYANMYIDPETEIGKEDPGWFSAAYYAIVCSDYDAGPGTPEERATRILAEANAFAPEAPRLLRSYYMERLACAHWPHQGPATRPAQFAGGDYPTLVLNGDRDPITPITMAYSVLDNAKNAYGVFMHGGPHVIWGRGFACPDTIVQALLYDGTRPREPEQICEQDFIDDYIPLTLTDPAEMADPFAVARAVDIELYQFIPLTYWDGLDPLALGCPFGGAMTAASETWGTNYSFRDCKFWPGLAISGKGIETTLDGDEDGLTLLIKSTEGHSGDLVYTYRTADEAWSLTGTWDGKPATLPRSEP